MTPSSRRASFVVWPPSGSALGVGSWLREVREMARVSLSPPPFPDNAMRGSGEPVIVLPGFCSPDISTARLRAFLLRQGFAVISWQGGLNIGPREATLAQIDAQIVALAESRARKVSLVGISLGGTLARELAKRRPDCVARVITLVSPIHLPIATPLAPLASIAALFWDRAAHGILDSLAAPPPVPLTAIVSPVDGVVEWRACVPAPSAQVETIMIRGAHMTMGSNPEAQRVIAARLAGRF
ncbi:MAG TPA: hypothetical protein VGF97_07370 [Rhizomicrobium sp.]|jgi:pimeloyl-ACP methyl ester carboxylesterase